MDDRIAPYEAVPSPTMRCRWRGVTLALTVACMGWLSLWSALRVQAAPNALTYPSVVAPCNTTLQACINAVPAGDTLLILPNTYSIPELTIPRAMTIQGVGVVLQAAGAHRVANIAASQGPVTLIGLTIRNGSGAANGGGILIGNDTQVQLINVIVRDSQSSGEGGGIYGGTGGSLQLVGTTLINNRAPGGSGGGLRTLANRQVTAAAATFVNNSALSHGAGMHVDGPLIIVSSQITGNTSSGGAHGGGVYAASGATISGTTVMSNVAGGDGGGLYATASLVVTNSLFSYNRALDDGGGIAVFGGPSIAFGVPFTGTNLHVSGNEALLGNGGGIFTADFVTITLQGAPGTQDLQFSGNRAAGSGGGVYVDGPAVVNNCLFAGNEADFGGGLFTMGDVTVTGCLIDDNTAITDGGGIFGNGDVTTILSSTVRFNAAALSAGGVWAENAARVANAAFIANQSGATGGGLHSNGGDSRVVAATFTANSAGNVVVDGDEQGGGAIYQSGGALTLQDVTLSNNQSQSDGGAIAARAPVIIDGSTLRSNQAQFDGGAVAARGPFTVTNSTFHTNTAGIRGGAIFAAGTLDTTAGFTGYAIAASDFVSNTVIDGDGGAIYAEGPLTITGSQFASNAADGSSSPQGGAVHHRGGMPGSLLTAADNVYTENYAAQQGGAVYTQGGAFDRELVVNNRSGSEGGGMAVQGNTTISHTVFTGNMGRLSGALAASGQSGNAITLTVLNSLFHNNGFTQTNTFAVGAEMKVFDANLFLINNTFADPQLPAGAIFRHGVQVFRAAVQAHNNIFVNYPTHGLGHGDPVPVTSTLVEDHNLFFNAPLGDFGGNLSSGGNSLTADPRFVDAVNGNYRLRDDSPAIDAGLDSVLPPALVVDLDGQPRLFDWPPIAANLVDIGAYESRKVRPVAVPGGPYAGLEGSPVALDATGSSGAAPLTFAWDCTDDGVDDVTLPTPTGATCTYPDDGTFTLRLTVSDQAGASSMPAQVTIANVTPTVSAPGNQAAQAAVAKQFGLGSFTDPGTDAPWTVMVDWGDNAPTTQFPQSNAGPIAAQAHTYAAPGAYTVTATVTDKDNGSHSTNFRVLVASVLEQLYLPLVSR